MKNRTQPTLVTFLLDRTGSMEQIKSDTIGGFNAYLDRLQEEAGDLIEFTLLEFDSMATDKICVGAKLSDVRRLTNDNFVPRAWTPLIDACVKTIKATSDLVYRRRADNPRVIVVFMTDGEENCSKEYTRDHLAQLIHEKTAAGWQFIYMGANIDAYKEAARLGINRDTTISYRGHLSGETFSMSAQNTVRYAKGLVGSAAYSSKQKAAAGDNKL